MNFDVRGLPTAKHASEGERERERESGGGEAREGDISGKAGSRADVKLDFGPAEVRPSFQLLPGVIHNFYRAPPERNVIEPVRYRARAVHTDNSF